MPAQDYFAVKVRLSGLDRDEYIWIGEVIFDGHTFIGQINGQAQPLPFPKVGDGHLIRVDEIYDWMIVDNGKLVGGHTIRVARDNMTAESRKQFDASLWFAVD